MQNSAKLWVAIWTVLFFLSIPFEGTAQRVSSEGKYPKEDFQIYKELLEVKSKETVPAAANALSYYPEGFSVLLDYIEKNASHYSSPNACRMLKHFEQVPDYEVRLTALRQKVDAIAAAKPKTGREAATAKDVSGQITRFLYERSPEKFRQGMIVALRQKLVSDGFSFTFEREAREQLEQLLQTGDKKELYVLVTGLIDLLGSSYADTRKTAHLALESILGTGLPLKDASHDERLETVDSYREYYYTKVKPLMKKP